MKKKKKIHNYPQSLECTGVRGQTALQPISPYQGEDGAAGPWPQVGRADVWPLATFVKVTITGM